MTDDDRKRLDVIEKKIDGITDILVEIARADERITQTEVGLDNLGKRVNNNEERLRNMELTSVENTQSLRNIVKLGYIVISAVVANIVYAIITSNM